MPKGDCFEAAYRKVQELHDDGDIDARLCHGFITHPLKKMTFAHAWVENNDFVIDASNDMNAVLSRDDFYELVAPTGVIEYDAEGSLLAFLRSEHYGPWHESFDGVA